MSDDIEKLAGDIRAWQKQRGGVGAMTYDVLLQRSRVALSKAADSARGFVSEVAQLQQQVRELTAFRNMVNRHTPEPPDDPDGIRDVWYWQGDGEDHLDSMVHQLPIVIRAEQLRELLASQAPAEGDPVPWSKTVESAALLLNRATQLPLDDCEGLAGTILSMAAPKGKATGKVAATYGDKWEGAEEWMPLAWELCANENGEEACTELVWEGGPIPEPWGDRWLKYEDQAKEMIAMVRKHVRPQSDVQPKGTPAERLPTKEHIRELAQEALDQIMEQAQVFASAWSLVGGKFDFGNAMSDAVDAKDELRTMVRSLADLAAETVRPVQAPAPAPEPVAVVESIGPVHGKKFSQPQLLWYVDFPNMAALVKPGDKLYTHPAALVPSPAVVARKPPKHKFWGAGEADCPDDIKAPNGELCRRRCKVCGETNPHDEYCWPRAYETDPLADEWKRG